MLDSGTFPADGNIDCRVVIQPSVIRSSSFAENHVAFHLSDFEVGASCKDTNFTVHDGHGKQTKAIAGNSYKSLHLSSVQHQIPRDAHGAGC